MAGSERAMGHDPKLARSAVCALAVDPAALRDKVPVELPLDLSWSRLAGRHSVS
jgi:hypothetical protein